MTSKRAEFFTRKGKGIIAHRIRYKNKIPRNKPT